MEAERSQVQLPHGPVQATNLLVVCSGQPRPTQPPTQCGMGISSSLPSVSYCVKAGCDRGDGMSACCTGPVWYHWLTPNQSAANIQRL